MNLGLGPLHPDDLHVVWALIDQETWNDLPVDNVLSPDERERAGRLKIDVARRRFCTGRTLLRRLLGAYLTRAPDTLRFQYNRHGKPALTDQNGEDELCFNLSHSSGLLLVAIGHGRELGIDVEMVRPVAEAEHIAGWLFPERERQRYEAAATHRRVEEFFRCWTRIEAAARAHGTGIAQARTAPSVPLTLYELAPLPGYIAALAAQGNGGNVHVMAASTVLETGHI